MSNNDSPITPPPELVQQWWDGTHGAFYEFEAVTTQAARWGWEQRGAVNEAKLQKARDEELEECCEYIGEVGAWFADPERRLRELRAARRPKPPSLKEQALEDFDGLMSELDGAGNYSNCAERIRRALEQLPDTL